MFQFTKVNMIKLSLIWLIFEVLITIDSLKFNSVVNRKGLFLCKSKLFMSNVDSADKFHFDYLVIGGGSGG